MSDPAGGLVFSAGPHLAADDQGGERDVRKEAEGDREAAEIAQEEANLARQAAGLLAGEELKAVTGGMLATFQYGNTAWLIWASAKDHTVIQVTAEPA